MLLAIDPGIQTGWALLSPTQGLQACGLGDEWRAFCGTTGDRAYIECPQVYRARFSKGDPNDLITLAVRVGRYAEACERAGWQVTLTSPHSWKGTLPKDVQARRVWRALTLAERTVMDDAGGRCTRGRGDTLSGIESGRWESDPRNNIMDAVALAKRASLGL